MTVERMIELLEIEKECVLRNASGECNRYCAGCDLLQDDTELHEMYTEAIALLKAQEHPTDECIRNAIFCLQNPHDCLETEVDEARKMSLYALKAREPKMVAGVAEIYKDILVGNCPSCGQTVVSNVKKPTKYCRFCGHGVKWE